MERASKIARLADDAAAPSTTTGICPPAANESSPGPATTTDSTTKKNLTMLPLPIAARIASFNVESTSQLARLRCVSRPFYHSLLDHTSSAGSPKHRIQCPSAGTHHNSTGSARFVYNFIDQLTSGQNVYFDNGDVIRLCRSRHDSWNLLENVTIEKVCLLANEKAEKPPFKHTTPLSVEKLIGACDDLLAAAADQSFDQFQTVAKMVLSDGLLQPMAGNETAFDEDEEENLDVLVFGAFVTVSMTPDVAQPKIRYCHGRPYLQLETTGTVGEIDIRPRRPNCSYIAPVISRNDEEWKAVVLFEVIMYGNLICDLVRVPICTIESLRLKGYWEKAQNNTRHVEGVAIVDDFFAGRESLCAKIDALAQLQAATFSIDYHPHSNLVVRNLVHPALYCYVDEVTTLQRPIAEAPPCTLSRENPPVIMEEGKDFWGRKHEASVYQFLPTYFNVAEDGSCTIEDYINNLIPRDNAIQFELYKELEKLFQSCLPFIESVYSYVRAIRPHLRRADEPLDPLDFEDDIMPTPLVNAPYCSLRGQKLQVITKIVDYELIREHTHTGVWHVEGMSHEEIVLTALYIADRDDEFHGADIKFKRSLLRPEGEYLVNTMPDTSRTMAVEQLVDEGLVPLGTVATLKGRLIVFPNSHVHKVSDMSFLPKSEHRQSVQRRIVVFFLVNPFRRIISTREVATQQMAYGGKMSLDDALAHRLQLMHERSHTKQDWNVRQIQLCEH
jgi:hypothetical protein